MFKRNRWSDVRIPHELIIQEPSWGRKPTRKNWVFWLLVPLVFIGLLVVAIKSGASALDDAETGRLLFENDQGVFHRAVHIESNEGRFPGTQDH